MKTEVCAKRDSSIELFRIITMFVIVAHHYVVNSGLMNTILNAEWSWRNVFLLLFGWGGKTGINCFVFITGYFMCQSNITLKKFLKLFLEVEFYTIIIYIIFLVTGYESFTLIGFIKAVLPFYSENRIGVDFTSSYLVFYLFIPFINVLIKHMQEKQHQRLILLCVLVFTILPSFLLMNVTLSYVTWFATLYLITSYIRMYPKKIYENRKIWAISTIVFLLLSWGSVVILYYTEKVLGLRVLNSYFFVSDSNQILALLTAFCAFMFFKNLNLQYNKWVNIFSTSTFGVLMIHANSNTMRQWLWEDVCNNIGNYSSQWLVLHAFFSVTVIYVVCTLIDILRIKCFERPFFNWFDMIVKENAGGKICKK